MTITSPQNEKLKEIRKLARPRARAGMGRFVAEGEDLLAAADAAGWTPVHRLVAADSGLEGEEVEPALLDAVSALGSGSRAIGVYETRFGAPVGPLCVYLHGVGDPGNVGTVLRSAAAFGAASVVLGPGCADPYGPKAVRASMGAIFGMPVARAERVAELPGTTVALVAGEGPPLHEAVWTLSGEVTVAVGAERTGLPREVAAACDERAHIPISTDSLNAAMAATVALYEISRITSA